MTAVVLSTVAAFALGALVLEGGTIVRCARAVGRGGGERLRRLGWTFLLTEVWVIALLGLAHAALPAQVHTILTAAWLPVMIYGLAWMVRDVGLWRIALEHRLGWAPVVAGGAGGQLLAAAWAFALAVGVRADLAPVAAHADLTTQILTVVAPICLGAGCGLLLWGRRTRPRSPRHAPR